MSLRKVAITLCKLLKEKQPQTFSSPWILKHAPGVYNYVRLNCRTENNDIDWDKLTRRLSRRFQKRWVRYRHKITKQYENQVEVDLILNKYKNKLYTFITPLDDLDRKTRENIIIALVRISQKGNTLAQQEAIRWLLFVVDNWIEYCYDLKRWLGYTDLIRERIAGCIRCYRYTGTFIGYLYKTLEYSGRGICYLQKYSFDEPVLDGGKTKIDYFIAKSPETEI
ncbi:MAG: hypothetical protein WC719_03005 [Patescibacteria group bacterium]|jgi:hypothetical protein